MRSTRLINARSASVPRFNGRYPASISFTITFTTASAFEPAAAGARRRTDGSADPRLCPESRLVLLHRISATNDGVRRLAAGGGSPSWSTSSADEPSSFGGGVHLRAGVSPQAEYWRGTTCPLAHIDSVIARATNRI